MTGKARNLVAVYLPVALCVWGLLHVLDSYDDADLVAAGVIVLVSGTLALWNFQLVEQASPTWEGIAAWVGRGLAKASYVALFGIPMLSALYASAETRPPRLLLLGYLSSLGFACATTVYILHTRLPHRLDPVARWFGVLTISAGFAALCFIFYLQGADMLGAYGKPQRTVSLEPARRLLARLDLKTRQARQGIDRSWNEIAAIRRDLEATGVEIRRTARIVGEGTGKVGATAAEISRAAAAIRDAAVKVDRIAAMVETHRKRLSRIFRWLR